jgi:hypothetical protein
VTIKFDDLRSGQGYDYKVASPNFRPIWKGGEWHLRDITNYMTTAAFTLLNHAADNRERWLTRFYEIGKEAVRPRKDGEPKGVLLTDNSYGSIGKISSILTRAQVRFEDNRRGIFVPFAQPYGMFAKALLERQTYPNLRDDHGSPIAPYDVTAHSVSLLMDAEVTPFGSVRHGWKLENVLWEKTTTLAVYKSFIPSMDEGWTRWLFEGEGSSPVKTFRNSDVSKIDSGSVVRTIIFPDQSPNQILNGYAKGSMPDEYTGGVGKEGVENLKKFVEAGGTLVFLNRSSNFAIEQFKLPVRDVTRGLNRKDFFIPGSILRSELDTTHPIAKGMPRQSIAWFENGPVFEMIPNSPGWANRSVPPASAGGAAPDARSTPVNLDSRPPANDLAYRIIATYPSDPKQILLSGWALGAEKIAGKAALIEFTIGKGKIILFGFRPQYRGQSLATFPLFFNAISQ